MQRDIVLDKLRELKPRYKEMNIRRLALFGSTARNEAQEDSDIDILIEFDGPAGLIALSQKKHELEEYLGCPVDVFPFNGLTKPRHQHILQECIDV